MLKTIFVYSSTALDKMAHSIFIDLIVPMLLIFLSSSAAEVDNDTQKSIVNDKLLLAEITPSELALFLNVTQKMVVEAYGNGNLNVVQRKEFGLALGNIGETHQQNLATIMKVNLTELPPDGNQLTPYIQQRMKDGLVSDDQLKEIQEEFVRNKVNYITNMIRIFEFDEDDYKTDRVTFCKFSKCSNGADTHLDQSQPTEVESEQEVLESEPVAILQPENIEAPKSVRRLDASQPSEANSDKDLSDVDSEPAAEPKGLDEPLPVWKKWEFYWGIGIGVALLIICLVIIIKCYCKK